MDDLADMPEASQPKPPPVSHAQQFEDIMLWRALKNVEKGTYIDIGASDPCYDSVSLLFYEQGWRGIHVEPSPRLAEKLRQARPDEIVVEAAVADGDLERMPFFDVADTAYTGMSTLNESIRDILNSRGIRTTPTEVGIVTLDKVFELSAGPEIHWLKIDVEGFEQRIIESWTSERRPWIVVIESIRPVTNQPNHETWEPCLVGLGYKFVWSDGINRFYLHRDHLELEGCFTHPVNVLDGVLIDGYAAFGGLVEKRRSDEVAAKAEEIRILAAENNRLANAYSESDERLRNLSAEYEKLKCGHEELMGIMTALSEEKTLLELNQSGMRSEYERILGEYQETAAAEDALRASVELLTRERDEAVKNSDQMRAGLEKATRVAENVAQEARRARDEVRRLDAASRKLSARNQALRLANRRQLENAAAWSDEKRELRRENRRLEMESHHLRLDRERLEKENARALVERADYAKLDARHKALELINRQLQTDTAAWLAERQRLLRQNRDLELECHHLRRDAARLEKELEQTSRDIADAKKVAAQNQALTLINQQMHSDTALCLAEKQKLMRENRRFHLESHQSSQERERFEREAALAAHEKSSLIVENARLQQSAQALERDLAALTGRHGEAEASVRQLRASLNTAIEEAETLRGSISWRITSPLRALGRLSGRTSARRAPRDGKTSASRAREPFIQRLKQSLKTGSPTLFAYLRNNRTIYGCYHRIAYGTWPALPVYIPPPRKMPVIRPPDRQDALRKEQIAAIEQRLRSVTGARRVEKSPLLAGDGTQRAESILRRLQEAVVAASTK